MKTHRIKFTTYIYAHIHFVSSVCNIIVTISSDSFINFLLFAPAKGLLNKGAHRWNTFMVMKSLTTRESFRGQTAGVEQQATAY